MSAGLWFLVAAILAALCLAIAGLVRFVAAARALVVRAAAMALPEIDLTRAQASMQRIHDDLDAMTALLERARLAIARIDADVRAIVRAFSRG